MYRGGVRRKPFASPALLFAAATSCVPALALADVTPGECIDANGKGQSLRRDGKFADARAELDLCNDPRCPALVRNDCAQRADELERAQPTIIFDVKDDEGNDVSEVAVTVDGHPLSDRLDGRALAVDPGEHSFGFAVAGKPVILRRFVVKEGQKERRESIALGAGSTSSKPAVLFCPPSEKAGPLPVPYAPSNGTSTVARTHPPPLQTKGDGDARRKDRKTIGLFLAGTGGIGIAVGAAFGLLALSRWSESKQECGTPTACSNHAQAVGAHDAALTYGATSTVTFIVGGLLAAGGIGLFFSPTAAAPPAANGTEAHRRATMSLSGARLALEGTFP
jgi:hypothetical protein